MKQHSRYFLAPLLLAVISGCQPPESHDEFQTPAVGRPNGDSATEGLERDASSSGHVEPEIDAGMMADEYERKQEMIKPQIEDIEPIKELSADNETSD